MRLAVIGLFFLGCLAMAAEDHAQTVQKPADKKSSWWDTSAPPATAEKGHEKATAPVKAPRPRASGRAGASAVEPLRWPEREALAGKSAPWVIKIEK